MTVKCNQAATSRVGRAALVGLLIAACTDGEARPVSFAPSTTSGPDSETGTSTGDGDGDRSGDGDMAGDGDGDVDLGDPPEVLSTSPAPGDSAVDPQTAFVVSFAAAMDTELLTTNSGAMTCSGGFQVSDDGFATCVPLDAEVGAADEDTTFTFTSLGELDSHRDYELRLAAYVATAAGAALAQPWTSAGSFTTRYYHHIEIDGLNDFDAGDEAFTTTSAGHTGYVAWDSEYIYLGLEGSAIQAGDPNTFVFAYLGGTPGSAVGVDYQGQAPDLPFEARWHPRWKTDGTYTNVQEFGGGWADTPAPLLGGEDIEHSGEFVELRLTRSLLGNPQTLSLVLGLLREGNDNPATFAGVPSTAFTDGFDPDFDSHYAFELDGVTVPAEHGPL